VFSNSRPVYYLPQGATAQVGRLVVIDEVSIGPFNMVPGEWPRLSDYAQHDAALMDFIQKLRAAIVGDFKPLQSDRRIFLSRPSVRRNFNQNELMEISKKYGFEAVYPETLSLREQAELFKSASHIIGASGAAWSGMIFCHQPVTGLSWLPSVYREFSSYSSLAHLLGHRLFFIEAIPGGKLSTTDEAYRADYRVCPFAFENALEAMMRKSEQ